MSRFGRPTEAEFLAAMRLVAKAEQRKVMEAEQLLRDARRILDVATADADRHRLTGERVVAEAHAVAERLALSSGEAERMRVAPIQAGGASDRGSLAREEASDTAQTAIEEAETLCHEARRLLETAAVDADRRRADADRALAESQTEADQVLAHAGRVLAAALADAERTRAEAAGDGPTPDPAVEAGNEITPEVDPGGALAAALADPEPAVRIGALETIPMEGMKCFGARLAVAAEDHDLAVRAAAFRRLATASSSFVWATLRQCSHRLELLAVLSDLAPDRLAGLLLAGTHGPDPAERMLAMELIGHLGTATLQNQVTLGLADVDPGVRRAAAAQLMANGDANQAVLASIGAVADPDADVRPLAAGARHRHSPDRLHRLAPVAASSDGSIHEASSEMATAGKVAPDHPNTRTGDVIPTGRSLVGRRHAYLTIGALLAITNLMVISRIDIPWITPTAAFVTILGIPTFLLYGANPAGLPRGSERLAVSAVLSVGLLMVVGLFANTVGPHLSIAAPLGSAGSIVIVDLAVLGLALWAWPRHPEWHWIFMRGPGGPGGGAVAGGAMAMILAVVGAVRLNNGAGAGVTLAALGLVLLTFAGLLVGRNRIEPGAVAATIYLLSAAILLMTSLRGWYTTGHDIQREFQVFQLTKSLGHWDISRYQDGYNACLSITILPTIVARWTRIADPYVFKILFQLLFALCPVIVYHLARRFVTGGLALVATIYFVAFPTFLQDMPFLNRQEVALLFLAAGLLCLFNPDVELARRRIWFCILAVGMVLSHYSTTYVTVAVLLSAAGLRIGVPLARSVFTSVGPALRRRIAARWAWIVIFAAGIGLSQLTGAAGAVVTVVGALGLHLIVPKLLGAIRNHDVPARQGWLLTAPARSSALGLGTIGFVAAASVLWSGPLTHTSGGITSTVSSAVAGLTGRSPASKSSDTSYSLFSTAKPSAARLLEQYRADAEVSSALRPATYYDAAMVSQYPTPVLAPTVLPATTLGAQVERLGVDLPGFNRFIRQGSARILQLFIAVGLLVGVFARRRSVVASADLICLAAANMFVLVLQVVLPALSVEYGVLRAFQQGLLVLDIFLVIGSVALVPRFFGRWQRPTAAVIALCFLTSSTGFVTQLLGGYGAQLHLNNSGQYFDLYYVHPDEVAAGAWLRQQVGGSAKTRIQSVVQTDRFTFPALRSLDIAATGNDIFPQLVRREAYVFLGYANVVEGQSTVSSAGDLITYRYPIDFLDANKDLLYSTAGSRVYR